MGKWMAQAARRGFCKGAGWAGVSLVTEQIIQLLNIEGQEYFNSVDSYTIGWCLVHLLLWFSIRGRTHRMRQ